MANKPTQPVFPLGLAAEEQSTLAGLLNTGTIEHGPDAVLTLPEGNASAGLPSSVRYNADSDEFEGFYENGGWLPLGGGGIRWEVLPHASTATLTEGRGYLINNTTGASTVVLPSPTRIGDSVTICDAYGKFATYPLTVSPSGNNLYGSTEDMAITTDNVSATFTWSGPEQGWIITSGVGLGQGRVYSREIFTKILASETSTVALNTPPTIVDVYADGKRLAESKYSLDGNVITFSPSLPANTELQVIEYTPIQLGNGGGSSSSTITWVYNGGSAIGGETEITLDVVVDDVPAIDINGSRQYKNLGFTFDPLTSKITLAQELEPEDEVVVIINGTPNIYNQIDYTLREVARVTNVKDTEVVYFSVGAALSGYKVIYDKETQRAYPLPADIVPGTTAVSLSSSAVLVHSAGSVDLGELAVSREEYVTLSGTFDSGAVINVKNELLTHTDGKYRWDGTLPKTVAPGSTLMTTGGVGVGAWISVGDASLKSELAKPTGAGFSGFDKSIDYETGTVGNALKKIINVNPDMYPSLQDAIDAAAALTGLEHAPSSAANHPDWLQPNTVSKVIRLNGKKYPISTTLHIHGDVSIDAGFGGVYLTDDFVADSSGYAVKCDKGTGNQYAGHISNLLIDARAKTVNGFKISDGYANKLEGIYVANVDGHGIHIAGGMGVHLLKFYAVGVLKPTNPLSTAHIVEGSDHQVSMGEGRYFRFGTWVRGGGNNRIGKVHNWGMYDDTVTDQNSRMKCCFVVQNSINNSFNQCFADSPSKWDYTKANLDPVDGYINGGIGFFIDGGATGNTFSQCQTFVNMNAFNDAGLSSYTASLMPFAVGSTNCSFIECENSNSPAWVARLITHIYSADQTFTNILAAKNFVGIEYDMVCNSTIFRKNVGVPVLVRNPKFETPTASYAPDFSDASYIAATVTGDVTITPAVLTNTLIGYVEVLLAVYSTTSKTITFGANVILASSTPSLTAAGTQVFRLSTTDGGTTWFCKFESAYP
ncbi:hypothetical protein [Escherichia phage YX22]|uniref:Tail spike TSP1/Gp66 N-terminal domain-containing protein n=1 Tax=Escherichia phage YX22 TaxID=3093951 RepID=A0AAX4G957_9CAUD|nr:hypothetical protein [Escherichia phage 2307YX22]